ncbi:DUF779 domain-containing protein [Helicobacter cynogastricus]|uniref:DUF779 domain-containing protein n=1 Tax=Helicobacter cynogastricus TaxID=329937 RepID=UPI000CF057C8|nr:DUF779 domain-containing protein [Helicobacter cynogastricus]
MSKRVVATEVARAFITELKNIHPEGFIFYHSCGCCDGSAVLVYAEADFKLGSNDVWLGEVEGVGFYLHAKQQEYQGHTQLILDVQNIEGSEFSLEYGMGKSFYLKSRIFTPQELAQLEAQKD